MTEKHFFNCEVKSKKGEMFIRNHFRNSFHVKAASKFPFDLKEMSDPYNHPYDVYTDPKTGSEIWVIGREPHCNTKEEPEKYEEGVVLYCEPKHKKGLIKKVSKLA